jgi:hypothetical protein
MGVITESMMRLRGEIGAWRHERAALQNDLIRRTNERRTRVSALRATFVHDLAGAHRAWFGPTLSERRAAEKQQQQAEEAKAKAQQEQDQQRRVEEAKAKAQREQEQQRRVEEAKAKAQREQEQQRRPEEVKTKSRREP